MTAALYGLIMDEVLVRQVRVKEVLRGMMAVRLESSMNTLELIVRT